MEKKLKEFKVYVAPNYGEKVYEVEAVSELEAELEAIKLHDRGRWESCIVEEKEKACWVISKQWRLKEWKMRDYNQEIRNRRWGMTRCDWWLRSFW